MFVCFAYLDFVVYSSTTFPPALYNAKSAKNHNKKGKNKKQT